MKKVISLLIYLTITLVLYGGLKILMPRNIPNPADLFPAVEDYSLVGYRGPLWPLKGPKVETPPILSHLAHSYPIFLNKHYWLDLPVERTSPKVFINLEYPQIVEILNYVEKSPTNFTKIGAGLVSYHPRHAQSINKKQPANFSGRGAVINHENHSLNPRKGGQRIRAP